MKILDWIIKIFEKLCMVALVVMTFVTFAQAFNRYVLKSSFVWAEELAILGMIWIAFLGSTIAIRKSSHTRIDFVINMLPARARRVIEVVDYLLMACFCGYLFYASIALVNANVGVLTTGLKVPRAVMYAALTFGMASMVIYLIAMAVCKAVGHDPDTLAGAEKTGGQ